MLQRGAANTRPSQVMLGSGTTSTATCPQLSDPLGGTAALTLGDLGSPAPGPEEFPFVESFSLPLEQCVPKNQNADDCASPSEPETWRQPCRVFGLFPED